MFCTNSVETQDVALNFAEIPQYLVEIGGDLLLVRSIRRLPRRFAPRNDTLEGVILSAAAIGREVEESVFSFGVLRILRLRLRRRSG